MTSGTDQYGFVLEIRGLSDLFLDALGLRGKPYTGEGHAPDPQNEIGRKTAETVDLFIGVYLRAEINAYPTKASPSKPFSGSLPIGHDSVMALARLLQEAGYEYVELLCFSGTRPSLNVAVRDGRLWHIDAADTVGSNGLPDNVQHLVAHDPEWDIAD